MVYFWRVKESQWDVYQYAWPILLQSLWSFAQFSPFYVWTQFACFQVIFQLMAPTVTFKNVKMQFIVSKRKHSTDKKLTSICLCFFSFVLLRGWIVLEWKRTYTLAIP